MIQVDVVTIWMTRFSNGSRKMVYRLHFFTHTYTYIYIYIIYIYVICYLNYMYIHIFILCNIYTHIHECNVGQSEV